jgi:hypothetical protein
VLPTLHFPSHIDKQHHIITPAPPASPHSHFTIQTAPTNNHKNRPTCMISVSAKDQTTRVLGRQQQPRPRCSSGLRNGEESQSALQEGHGSQGDRHSVRERQRSRGDRVVGDKEQPDNIPPVVMRTHRHLKANKLYHTLILPSQHHKRNIHRDQFPRVESQKRKRIM